MNRREKLLEQYEDAYFALLMYEVAEQEGARLERINKELQDDPKAAVPEQIDRKCNKAIDRHFARQRRGGYWRTAKHMFTHVAVVVTVMVMMFTTAFALSPDFRASALNLLITFEEQYTQLTMNGNATGGNTSQTENSAPYDFTATYFEHLEVGWIPEGFTCTRNDYDSSALFEDSAGQFFSINRADGHGTLNVDTEDADSVVNITVNGINGIQVLKDGRIHSVLSDLEHGLFIQLRTSSGISTEIHQRILENIKYIA